jgi:hypothetical protein
MHDAGADAERPSRGGNQQLVRLDDVASEIGLPERVFDKTVGSGRVGHAQERLGEDHQREPFFAGQSVFAQQFFDVREGRRLRANGTNQVAGECVDGAVALPVRFEQFVARDIVRLGEWSCKFRKRRCRGLHEGRLAGPLTPASGLGSCSVGSAAEIPCDLPRNFNSAFSLDSQTASITAHRRLLVHLSCAASAHASWTAGQRIGQFACRPI